MAKATLEKSESMSEKIKQERIRLDAQEAAALIAVEMLDDIVDSVTIICESQEEHKRLFKQEKKRRKS